ncbi:MAG: peptidylprolyl isomerase [Dehalococcoidia bacterium]
MPDRNRRQDRRRPQQQDVPVIHEAPPYEPPPAIARLASPVFFVPLGLLAGLLLFAIAFAMRDDDDAPIGAGPVGTATATTPAGTPTTEPTPTPDPRMFEQAEDVTEPDIYNYRATIETDKGTIEIDLFEDLAPKTVNNFVFLAGKGFYDGLTWHLVQENFIAETGDPRTAGGEVVDEEGEDGPGYLTNDETTDLKNTRGTISMAKEPGASNFGSKFFINLKDNPALDAGSGGSTAYYPFAAVMGDLGVLDAIEQGDVIQGITIEELPKPEPTSTAEGS